MAVNRTLLALGLLIALGAALLLILGAIESGPAAAIGILGIGLVAAAGAAGASGRGGPRSGR